MGRGIPIGGEFKKGSKTLHGFGEGKKSNMRGTPGKKLLRGGAMTGGNKKKIGGKTRRGKGDFPEKPGGSR